MDAYLLPDSQPSEAEAGGTTAFGRRYGAIAVANMGVEHRLREALLRLDEPIGDEDEERFLRLSPEEQEAELAELRAQEHVDILDEELTAANERVEGLERVPLNVLHYTARLKNIPNILLLPAPSAALKHLETLTETIDDLEGKVSRRDVKIADLKKQVKKLEKPENEKRDEQGKYSQLEKQNQELLKTVAGLTDQLNSEKEATRKAERTRDRLQRHLMAAWEAFEESPEWSSEKWALEQQLQDSTDAVEKLEDDVEELESENNCLKSINDKKQIEIDMLNVQLDLAMDHLEDRAQEVARQEQQIVRDSKRISTHESQARDSRAKIESLERDINQARMNALQDSSKITALENKIKEQEENLRLVKDNHGLLADKKVSEVQTQKDREIEKLKYEHSQALQLKETELTRLQPALETAFQSGILIFPTKTTKKKPLSEALDQAKTKIDEFLAQITTTVHQIEKLEGVRGQITDLEAGKTDVEDKLNKLLETHHGLLDKLKQRLIQDDDSIGIEDTGFIELVLNKLEDKTQPGAPAIPMNGSSKPNPPQPRMGRKADRSGRAWYPEGYEFLTGDGSAKDGNKIVDVTSELHDAVGTEIESLKVLNHEVAIANGDTNRHRPWSRPVLMNQCVRTRGLKIIQKITIPVDPMVLDEACGRCVEKGVPCIVAYIDHTPVVLPLPAEERTGGPLELGYYVKRR